MFIHHPQGLLIIYVKVTLIKRKDLYKWLLQRTNACNDNEFRIVNSLDVKSAMFPNRNFHKYTSRSVRIEAVYTKV